MVSASDIASGAEITVRVSDTGRGLSESQAQRLFTRFEQGDGSITRQFGGTGLGLAISRSLARMMGGDITLSSETGVGSEFVFRFQAPRVAADEPPVDEAITAHPAHSGPRVLVAEDNPNNRRIVGMVLETIEAQVVFVENGQEAVDAFAPGRFDIVLMDLQMPVMDGLSATRAIRACERRHAAPAAPIIALSANAMTITWPRPSTQGRQRISPSRSVHRRCCGRCWRCAKPRRRRPPRRRPRRASRQANFPDSGP